MVEMLNSTHQQRLTETVFVLQKISIPLLLSCDFNDFFPN